MNPLARIIDANANRAREALRVMEDVARFALGDGTLTAQLKSLRHELRAALDALPLDRAQLLAGRDTGSDVGVPIKTEAELRRDDVRQVCAAAASRLTEALRSLEESAKALGTGAGTVFEGLRYRSYAADKALTLALGSPARGQWRLCVLITERLCKRPWREVAELAIEGGADCLQLREKELGDRELLARARALVALARARGIAVVVNDRPDIALLAGADGVHLGQADTPLLDARALAGTRLLIGVSTENLDQAHGAAGAGADYIALGPMFPTTTKDKPRLAGAGYVRAFMAEERLAHIPHLAVGGIRPDNAQELARAGCRGVAVSSCVCAASDPAGVCRELLAAMRAG